MRRHSEEPKYAAKIYQIMDQQGFSANPETLVVQQLVKKGNRYVADAGKQKVISFAMSPGTVDQKMVKAIFAALRGELKESEKRIGHKARHAMIAELKRVAVPVLEELGFEGSFPRFRRVGENHIDLLDFRFAKGHDQFAIRIGKFPPHGHERRGIVIPPARVEMGHLPPRLQTVLRAGPSDRHWFMYRGRDLTGVAQSIIPLLRGPAEEWWSCAESEATADRRRK